MCTSIQFTDADGYLYFGRNLDWFHSYGEGLFFTPRNHPANTGKNAIVGVGIEYEGFPTYFDCANEHGLAAETQNFVGYAAFPKEAAPGTQPVEAFTFPFWVAANFKTLEEVREGLKHITAIDSSGTYTQHWMVGDATGSLVIECQEDGMHVYENPVNVMANQPPFGWHLENLRNYLNSVDSLTGTVSWGDCDMTPYGVGGGMRGIPGDIYSTSRFVRAAYMNTHYPATDSEAEGVARLFHMLEGVSMVKGCGRNEEGKPEYTVYASGYSQREQRYYYHTYADTALHSIALADFDPEGTACVHSA